MQNHFRTHPHPWNTIKDNLPMLSKLNLCEHIHTYIYALVYSLQVYILTPLSFCLIFKYLWSKSIFLLCCDSLQNWLVFVHGLEVLKDYFLKIFVWKLMKELMKVQWKSYTLTTYILVRASLKANRKAYHKVQTIFWWKWKPQVWNRQVKCTFRAIQN